MQIAVADTTAQAEIHFKNEETGHTYGSAHTYEIRNQSLKKSYLLQKLLRLHFIFTKSFGLALRGRKY